MAKLTWYYLFLMFLVNEEFKTVSSQNTETVLILDCYKCGMRNGDDYCASRKSRWTEKSCQTTAKLSNDEALACTKITFEDWREGKGPSIYQISLLNDPQFVLLDQYLITIEKRDQ